VWAAWAFNTRVGGGGGMDAQMIAEDELLEYAVVYGQYKGIPKKHIRAALARGTDVVLRVDVQGAATLKRLIPQVRAATAVVCPPAITDAAADGGRPQPVECLRGHTAETIAVDQQLCWRGANISEQAAHAYRRCPFSSWRRVRRRW